MAYETGTATDHTDLINAKLKAFCVANGWTVNNDGYPTWLAMSKGDCYINIRKDSSSTSSMTSFQPHGRQTGNDAFGVSRTDDRIWFNISGGYTATSWEGQTEGSVDSTATSEPHGIVNDLTGPFVAYHFYSSDPGDEYAFIGMTVETIDDHYNHFFFGEVDKGILTYTPKASFAMGQAWFWWPETQTYSSRDDIASYALHRTLWQMGNDNIYQTHIHPGGAFTLPNGNASPGRSISAINEAQNVFVMEENDVVNKQNEPAGEWEGAGVFNGVLFGGVEHRPPLSYSGVTLLYPQPVIVGEGGETPGVNYWLGTMTNIRYVSMRGLTAGQEITFGSDTWQCWPLRRIYGGSRIAVNEVPASPGIANTSHYSGVAIKKTTT